MFIGRQEELELLHHFLGGPHTNALLLYGKRRVGKSMLIMKATEVLDCKVIYMECLQSTLDNNLELLTSKIKQAVDNKYLHFNSFTQAFEFLGTLKEKLVVIIDEYSYLKEVGGAKYVDSLFQSIIDKLTDNVDLVLLGSYVSIMRELLERENPLFGRFSLVMKVKPFDYYEASLFYPQLSSKAKIDFYASFGGLPMAHKFIDSQAPLSENIIKQLLNPDGILRLYVENILLKELSKVAPANLILSALANGKKKYSELEQEIGLKSNGNLDKQLKTLLDLEVIKKVYPINKLGDRKKTFYEIDDNLVRFYYAYIYGRGDIILRIGARAYYDLYINKSIITFITHRFEEIVREYFLRKVRDGQLKGIYDVGSFWYDFPAEKRNGEFDCALKLEEGYAFYEVKYYDRPLKLRDMQQEAQQVLKLAEFIKVQEIGFVSLQGFEPSACEDYRFITADELY